jgi:hypothetical protein
MQQLNGKVVLMPFADWPQHGGQPVTQSTEPAEPVHPGSEIAVPSDQPGGGGGGIDRRRGLLADRWRIVGLAAACSHRFLQDGVSLWLDRENNLLGHRSLCSSHLAAHAWRESPPKLANGTDLDSDGRQRHGDGVNPCALRTP